MFVKPADGRKVRDPISMQHLPDTGTDVPENTYWLRRLSEGDVIDVPPTKPAPKATKE